MKTFAIGDLQGCLPQAFALLDQISAVDPNAQLIFLGDVVNRGPQSLQALRHIRDLGTHARVVLGNHDLHLLAVAKGVRRQSRSDTLDEILNAPDRDELLDWLRARPLALAHNENLLVHAGVAPQWTVEQTLERAAEVEAVLRGPGWIDFLSQMYGNAPLIWADSLSGPERLRCIVNVLTRIRFCDEHGKMDLSLQKGGHAVLPGYMPWFEVPGRKTANDTVVFGHWSTLGLVIRPRLIALDTGCLWGGQLSAVCLEDRTVLQVQCPEYQRSGEV
jgi:bis(5'-nucleosyl)-tetraphosphatase (symmetrical)